ncbi:MAG: choice-of-anchor D domain-containing protein, partial [Candidatus Eisenbacteria bacterium]|nr:choice-of-anchor D domain-containing protein [Candidatus Eisenbacteria bacterium]
MKLRCLFGIFVNCILFFLVFASQSFAQDFLSGRVYSGDLGVEPPAAAPLSGVTVKLYGGNNSGQLTVQIDQTQTDAQGWYSLAVEEGWEYYNIVEVDLSDYYSVGATSPDGTVINSNQIQYDVSVPLSQQTTTGNKFWDKPEGQEPEEPEMDVKGNSISISDGDTSPSTADDTDFGAVSVSGGTHDHTFTIRNTGSMVLNLFGSPRVNIGGAHAGDFLVTVEPAPTVSSGGGTTTFTVRFDPGASGLRSATISIDNDDANENPYNFSIQGTGEIDEEPEIDVRGNGISITNGDTTPSTADWTDIGGLEINTGSITKIFTIHNTGTATLNITSIGLSQDVHNQGGSVAAIWGIIPGVMSIASGSSTTLGVEFFPYLTGTYVTTLIIESNDSNEGYYTFDVQGAGTAPETGSIMVEKVTDVSTTDLFTFTGDASGSITNGGQIIVSDLQPGTYTSVESPLSGWTLTDITFDDDNSTYDLQTRTATFVLEAGETVRAVFTNQKDEVPEYDFGDAPDPAYPTLLANNGARHLIDPDVYLGTQIDAEADGVPDAGAQGDDNNNNDDEDGVLFVSPLIADSTATVNVTASTEGLLYGWIDFDQNGTWDMPDDYV